MTTATLQGATVLITGGTGTFGTAFLDECLAAGADEIRIFSRDEKKQYDMAQRYRENHNVRFFLGDIRDKRSITIYAGMTSSTDLWIVQPSSTQRRNFPYSPRSTYFCAYMASASAK